VQAAHWRTAQVETEAHRLALLQRVTGAAGSTLDLSAVLQGLLAEIVAALPATQAGVMVYDDPAVAQGVVWTQYPAHPMAGPLLARDYPLLARMQTAAGPEPLVLNAPAADGVPP
jgi:hypothetical protein